MLNKIMKLFAFSTETHLSLYLYFVLSYTKMYVVWWISYD